MFRILLALFLSASTSVAAAQALNLAPAPGPYEVGLQVRQHYDRTRVYRRMRDNVTAQIVSGERTRPVQTLVWYPAAGKGETMRYRDYITTMASEERFDAPEQARRDTDAAIKERLDGPRGPALEREFERAMLARRDADALPGKFPVLIYAPSYSASAMENADLCEYLASRGYIVLASASMGARTRGMTSDLEGLEAQAADIAFLMAQAASIRQADMAHVAAIGFSWGGLANVMAAGKDDRIRAVVSIDGSVRTYPQFVNGGAKAAYYVTPERLAIPMLYVARRNRTIEEINASGSDMSFSLMNRMRYSDVYIATMLYMNHMDFSSWALRINDESAFDDHTREEAAQAERWTAQYIAHFLDAYLKNDKAGQEFINRKPEQNGIPPHLMSLAVHKAKATAPTQDTFLEQLSSRGFGQIIGIYDGLHAQDAGFTFDPVEIDGWGTQLLRAGRAQDAAQVFALGVHIYPDGVDFLYDDLGEAEEKAGHTEEAIAAYRRVLSINPDRTHARMRLKALGAAETAAK